MTAVGYLGDPESLPEGPRKSEVAPRQRKDLKEIVFSEGVESGVLIEVLVEGRSRY